MTAGPETTLFAISTVEVLPLTEQQGGFWRFDLTQDLATRQLRRGVSRLIALSTGNAGLQSEHRLVP